MLRIAKNYVADMIAHSLEEDPNECCGILVGNNETVRQIYRITNTAKSRFRYLMDPQEQLDAMLNSERDGRDLLGFYHSHTHSPAYPSSTDVRMALQSGWLDVYYVLVSLEDKEDPGIRIFLINENGEVAKVEYELM